MRFFAVGICLPVRWGKVKFSDHPDGRSLRERYSCGEHMLAYAHHMLSMLSKNSQHTTNNRQLSTYNVQRTTYNRQLTTNNWERERLYIAGGASLKVGFVPLCPWGFENFLNHTKKPCHPEQGEGRQGVRMTHWGGADDTHVVLCVSCDALHHRRVIPTKRSAWRNPFSSCTHCRRGTDPSTPLRFAQDDTYGVQCSDWGA